MRPTSIEEAPINRSPRLTESLVRFGDTMLHSSEAPINRSPRLTETLVRFGDTMLHGSVEGQEAEPTFDIAQESPEALGLDRIIVSKPEKIDGTEGFYNPAAWRIGDKTYLLGREVEMPVEEPAADQEFTADGEPIMPPGGPDIGPTVLKVLGPDGKIIPELTRIVFESKEGGPSYEDFRVLLSKDGTLIFGLTWVEPDGAPYPAVLITNTEELMGDDTVIEPQIIRIFGSGDQTTPLDEEGIKLPGKNLVPIGRDYSDIDRHSFIFREQGKENRHRLRVFNVKGDIAMHRQYIELPKDKKWGEWAMGTNMSPEWTDETQQEAFMLIHGIAIVNGRYAYSTVSARLFRGKDGELAIDNIDDEPVLNSALFDDVVQRHKGRDAFYTVGWVPHRDEDGNLMQLEVFGSPGDSRTDRVLIDPRERMKHWKRTELAMVA